MNLHSTSLAELSNLEYEYSTGTLPGGHGVVVTHFSGTMENSRATDDFAFASAIIIAGLEAWQPWATIIDLSKVSYSWGDRMEDVLLCPQRWAEPISRTRRIFTDNRLPERFPVAIVTSPRSEEGLVSLISKQMNIGSVQLLFRTLQAAIDALGEQLADTPII